MKLWADAAGRYRSADGDPDLVNAAGAAAGGPPQGAVDAISSYSRNMSSWPRPAAAAAAAAGESNGPFDLAALDAETNNIKTTLKYTPMMRDNDMTNNSVYKGVKFPLIPDSDTTSSSVPALEDPRMPEDSVVNNSVTALQDPLMPDTSMVNNLPKALTEPVMRDNSMPNNFTEALNNPLMRDNSMVTNFVAQALNDPVMQDNSVVNNFAEALKDTPMRDNSVVNNFAPTLKDTPMRGNGVVKDFKAILKDRLIRHKNMFTLAQGMMYSNAFASIESGAVESSRPKRRNVKISKDPQSVAARLRREKISDRIRVLQSLVPGGSKMDTASMLDEAINYVKFLKAQVQTLETVSSAAAGGFDLRQQNPLSCGPGPLYRHSHFPYSPTMSMDCATVVSQGLSSAPSSDHFDTLFPPGGQILSYSSSFPDNTYREQFCH